MSFTAQFDPEDVRYVGAHRYIRPNRPVVYFVGANLHNGNGVTLAGEDPATMRALLTSMLDALATIAPDGDNQDEATIPARFDDKPPWAAATKDSTAQVTSGPAATAPPAAPVSPPKPPALASAPKSGGPPAVPAAPPGVPLEIPTDGERR